MPDSHLDKLDYESRAQQFREWLTQNNEETYIFEQNGKMLNAGIPFEAVRHRKE